MWSWNKTFALISLPSHTLKKKKKMKKKEEEARPTCRPALRKQPRSRNEGITAQCSAAVTKMRWKSDLTAAECCAASEDESGSLRSGDEVGHADSSVDVWPSRVGPNQLRAPGLVPTLGWGAIFKILQKKRKGKREKQKMTPSSKWRN